MEVAGGEIWEIEIWDEEIVETAARSAKRFWLTTRASDPTTITTTVAMYFVLIKRL